MLAPRVVEHLDVVEHVLPCLLARPVDLAADSLALEQIEEALCHGVVVAVPAPAHRMLKIVVLQEGCPIHAGELGALIRVDQDRGLRLPSPYRHEQRLQHDIGDLPALQGPANDTAGEQVDHHGQVFTPRFSYRAENVVATLERVCAKLGYPKTIRVDQGSEFVSRDLDLWAYAKGVTLDFSRPGKPTDNAFIEAFNGRFRSECLNTHWFLTLADAAEKMEAWLRYYNEDRPHGAIGNKPPILLQNPGGAPSLPP